LEYFTVIWYILWPFGNVVVIWYIFPRLVYFVKKNLATLVKVLRIKSWKYHTEKKQKCWTLAGSSQIYGQSKNLPEKARKSSFCCKIFMLLQVEEKKLGKPGLLFSLRGRKLEQNVFFLNVRIANFWRFFPTFQKKETYCFETHTHGVIVWKGPLNTFAEKY
jgi:hypothetical protein